MSKPFSATLFISAAFLLTLTARAWDYEGHRMVNQLALASLPADFPAFVREPANAERIAFLAGEPDRWRNSPDMPFKQYNVLDHYLDLEQLTDAGIDPASLSPFRFDFAVQFAAGRTAHASKFSSIDPAKNPDHSREWPGFAPWAITEYYGKLKSAFSYLKAYEGGGTPEEVANAQANILYVMGLMGHYVGDCAQPLHTTVHHNGWFGDNPRDYTRWPGLHSWIDGGFIAKAGIKIRQLAPRIKPAQRIPLAVRPDARDPLFTAVLDYLYAQHKMVEPLYQLEKQGKLSNELEKTGKFHQDTKPVNEDGRAFIEGQLLKGGEMLGSLWATAWHNAAPDVYLQVQLIKRQAAADAATK